MYYGPKEHGPAHIHTYYQDSKATFEINSGELLQGTMPSRQTKMILAWIEIHREELMANWVLCQNGEKPFKIDPLK